MARRQANAAKVAAYAEMLDFPCTRQELLQMADEQQFPDDVLNALEELPNRMFEGEHEVAEAVYGAAETSAQPETEVEVRR
jgi:hypothetical protein